MLGQYTVGLKIAKSACGQSDHKNILLRICCKLNSESEGRTQ